MKTLSTLILLFFYTTVTAQYEDVVYTTCREKELSLYGGLGLLGLHYKTGVGNNQDEFSPNVGLRFRIGLSEFSSTWSVLSGLELSTYKTVFNLDNLYTYSDIIDIDESVLEFRNTVSAYEEIQSCGFLQVPLMLQVQTTGRRFFYLAIGGKIGLPIWSKYNSSTKEIKNTGYHPDTDSEFDSQHFMGFGVFNNRKNFGKTAFNPAFMASAEAGVQIIFGKISVGVSGYIDYGLNDIRKKPELAFVEYNITNPRQFTINSVLQSVYTVAGEQQSFTDKIVPLSFGIKIQVGFNKCY